MRGIFLSFLLVSFCVDASAGSIQDVSSAFKNRLSDIQVQGIGTVVRVLSDDSNGSRHQRFILKLSSQQTVLVAHNIDIAPRLNELSIGDSVTLFPYTTLFRSIGRASCRERV